MTKLETPKERYIAIATRVFAENGFHGASLAALAQEAGVTKQALLHYFSSKEHLYADVLTALSERLCADIETVEAQLPDLRLKQYLVSHIASNLAQEDDARLVVRALLDAQEGAKIWPLRPYLDRLIALGRETDPWKDAEETEILAAIYSIIGAAQYVAISNKTLRGIYGAAALERFKKNAAARIETLVDDLF